MLADGERHPSTRKGSRQRSGNKLVSICTRARVGGSIRGLWRVEIMQVINKYGEIQTISAGAWFVTMTDKFLSGWGCADGKTHKQVIICKDYKQARRLADGIKNTPNSGMRYINITDKLPRYGARYSVSYESYSPAFIWLKYTQIPE